MTRPMIIDNTGPSYKKQPTNHHKSFIYPTCVVDPVNGYPTTVEKIMMELYRRMKDMFYHFDTVPECDVPPRWHRIDRQTTCDSVARAMHCTARKKIYAVRRSDNIHVFIYR